MASALLDRLNADIIEAMKARQSERLLALRTLLAEIKRVAIDTRKETDDSDVATVVSKAIKQRIDSEQQFEAAGRVDLVANERFQRELYAGYLPQQLSSEQIAQLVDEAIVESGASSKKDMGLVMKVLMPKVKGKADGKIVNQIVNEKLT
jgi:uncharacterized protein YqeY